MVVELVVVKWTVAVDGGLNSITMTGDEFGVYDQISIPDY